MLLTTVVTQTENSTVMSHNIHKTCKKFWKQSDPSEALITTK
jgi:hypothetical protein